eukprot:c17012_g1_i2.p1 GENE.c17012_g1_i2~~c17012_g1_i2.p1  ORF type:complete len:575 (+),score=79.64 c17012_g1_i2:107-1831(+)
MEFVPCEAYNKANSIRAALPKNLRDEDDDDAMAATAQTELANIVQRALAALAATGSPSVMVVGQSVEVKQPGGLGEPATVYSFNPLTKTFVVAFEQRSLGSREFADLDAKLRIRESNVISVEDRCIQLSAQLRYEQLAAPLTASFELPSPLEPTKGAAYKRREIWNLTLLHFAAVAGMQRLIANLLERIEDSGSASWQLVHAAGTSASDPGARRQVTDLTALHLAVLAGHHEVANLLAARSPLTHAADNFVAQGAQAAAVALSAVTPLFYALRAADAVMVQLLLAAGRRYSAPVETRQGHGSFGDERDETSLRFLAVLLDSQPSADPCIFPPPRHPRTEQGVTECALALVSAGAPLVLPPRRWRMDSTESYPGADQDAAVTEYGAVICSAHPRMPMALALALAEIAFSHATYCALAPVIEQLIVRPHAHRGDFEPLQPAPLRAIVGHLVGTAFVRDHVLPRRLPRFVLEPPGPPSSLRAEQDPAAPATAVRLFWGPPSHLGGALLRGYRLEQSLDWEVRKGVRTVGEYEATATRAAVDGLEPGVQVYFRLVAITRGGEGKAAKARVRTQNNAEI